MTELKVLPVLDEHGYPTKESLRELQFIMQDTFPAGADAPARWQRAVDAFYLALTVNHYGFCGPTIKEVRGEMIPVWEYHTGGWSGHEQIIEALASSIPPLWGVLLQRYDAGGHYYFRSPVGGYHGTRPSLEVVAYLRRLTGDGEVGDV